MKTLLGTTKYILPVVAILTFALVLPGQAQEKKSSSGKVEIRKEGITIHPTVRLSPEDTAKLDAILSQYEKNTSLFKINTLKSGQVVKSQGAKNVLETTVGERATAMKQGQDGVENNSACPNNGCQANQYVGNDPKKAKELQAALADLFKKYQ